MEISIESIIAVVTIIATYLFGTISKKFNIMESRYIPIQNMMIGLTAGLICYIAGYSANPITAIIYCLTCSMATGGAYDLVKTKSDI